MGRESEKIGRQITLKRKERYVDFILRLFGSEDRGNIVLLITLSLLTTILLFPYKFRLNKTYSINDVAEEDIRVENNITIIDEVETEILRDSAEKKAPKIYNYDKNKKEKIIKSVKNSFSTMRKYLASLVASDSKLRSDRLKIFHEESEKFKEKIQLDEREYNLLKDQKFGSAVEDVILSQLVKILDRMIVENKDNLIESKNQPIIVNTISDNSNEENKISDFSSIMDIDVAREQLEINALSDHSIKKIKEKIRPDIIAITKRLVQPNLALDSNKTEEAKRNERERVKAVTLNLKKGEVIAREGDRITDNHLMIINQTAITHNLFYSIKIFLGILIFSIFIFLAIYFFAKKNIRSFHFSFKNILFIGAIFLLTFIILDISKFISDSIYESFEFIPYFAYLTIVPLFGLPMIVSLILQTEIALTFILVQFIFIGLWGILKGLDETSTIFYIAYYVIGAFFSIREISNVTWRITLLKIGIFAGCVNSISVFLITLISDRIGVSFSDTLYLVTFALCSGVLSSIVVLGIVPVIESLGFTTNFSLLELANTDHPLLSRLAIQAPGTYHHSFIVSRLAENAAEEIGANSLLTKVATLYHDIGKIEKSQYFIENQVGSQNKHDKLTPRMSSLIIVSHVKDGVELARRYKLPEVIIDIISQHHGTSVIAYFFSKAKEKEDSGFESVAESDYSYPGPKPQTKEAAIIMLADATEATSRSISDPTPSRLKTIVTQVVNKFFTEGQLDECRLTFKELDVISKSFLSILSKSIYHHRIEYPGRQEQEDKREQNGDQNSKQSKKTKDQSNNNSKNLKVAS